MDGLRGEGRPVISVVDSFFRMRARLRLLRLARFNMSAAGAGAVLAAQDAQIGGESQDDALPETAGTADSDSADGAEDPAA